jgi:hypothetical protein
VEAELADMIGPLVAVLVALSLIDHFLLAQVVVIVSQ